MQVTIVGYQFLDLLVGPVNVLGIARQGCPAERAYAAAEQGPHICRHEPGKVERILHAVIERDLAYVVAVIECRHACGIELEHRFDVH